MTDPSATAPQPMELVREPLDRLLAARRRTYLELSELGKLAEAAQARVENAIYLVVTAAGFFVVGLIAAIFLDTILPMVLGVCFAGLFLGLALWVMTDAISAITELNNRLFRMSVT